MKTFQKTVIILFFVSIICSCYCGDNSTSLQNTTRSNDTDNNNRMVFVGNDTLNDTRGFGGDVLTQYNVSSMSIEWALTSYSEMAKRLIEMQYKDLPYGKLGFVN